MTTLRQIVNDAFREGGLVQVGLDPEADQFDEAFRRLTTFISSVFGGEFGEGFVDASYGIPAAGNAYSNAVDLSSEIDSYYFPSNVRLVVNMPSAKTLYLNPNPQDGARISIVDIGGNLSSRNLTLNANGRNIDGATTVTLSTNGLRKDWFYRADLGSWVAVSDLQPEDESPFPMEFDDYLVITLSMRLNPRYQSQTAPETLQAWKRVRSKFTARYVQSRQAYVESGLVRLSGSGQGSLFEGSLPSYRKFDTGIID